MKTSEVKTLHKKTFGEPDGLSPSIEKMGEVDRFSNEDLDRLKVVYSGMSNTGVLNIFRELRTQLLKRQQKKNFICMVTSICHKGGASYIASNLAAVFALDKQKTSILIDSNLYAPNLDRFIIGGSTIGITDYLSSSSVSVKDIVYATGIPRYRVIPIGENSEGAAEYFESSKMIQFADEIRSRYADRFVFIDAPPIAESSEARILADIADMVVLVVPHGMATTDQVEAAIDIIGKDKFAGLIYNN